MVCHGHADPEQMSCKGPALVFHLSSAPSHVQMYICPSVFPAWVRVKICAWTVFVASLDTGIQLLIPEESDSIFKMFELLLLGSRFPSICDKLEEYSASYRKGMRVILDQCVVPPQV